MKDYTKTINGVVKVIVNNEVKKMTKIPSENVAKKRSIALQIAINKEIEFIQSILANAKVIAKDKDRFIRKMLKNYATEAENGNKMSAKTIKKIRKSIINEIENYEIAALKKKQKIEKTKQAKKDNFEAIIDKMMETKNAKASEKVKIKTITNATTLSKDRKVIIASKLKNQKFAKDEKKKEITALVIKDDRFINRLKRTINDFSRKIQVLFKKKKAEQSFKFVEENGKTSILSQKSTSANAFIKRVCVDVKKVNKLAAMNARSMAQGNKR